MKKWMAILLALCLLRLCACTVAETEPGPYTVKKGETSYTVTPGSDTSGTISDGTYTYSYRYETTGNGYSVTFDYPDGERYTWTENGSSGTGAVSPNFDMEKYPDGMTLKSVLARMEPEAETEKNGLLIFVLLLVGVVNTAWPKGAWYLSEGWKYKDAEPSDAALTVNRLVGIAALVVAGILILA